MSIKQTFKLHPNWKLDVAEYFDVYIFDSIESMLDYYKNHDGGSADKFFAITRDYRRDKYQVERERNSFPKEKLGEMYFSQDYLTPEVISHECAHMVIRSLRNIYGEKMWTYIEQDDPSVWKCEEQFCEILGNVIAQFYRNISIISDDEY